MQSISKFGIFQRRINPTLILTHLEPKSTKQAVVDPTWLTVPQAEERLAQTQIPIQEVARSPKTAIPAYARAYKPKADTSHN